MGGTDESSNLIKLPLWAHAEVHKRLFEVYGNIEDDIASRMLSSKTEGIEELRIELAKRNFRKWLNEKPEEVEKWKEKQRNVRKGNHPFFLQNIIKNKQKSLEVFQGVKKLEIKSVRQRRESLFLNQIK